jgi:predicted flap endonuclease-1-like 5' DNA nuclease
MDKYLEIAENFFTQLFTELSSEDSLAILFFLFVAFLLGLFFGWLSLRSRTKKQKKALKKKEEERSEALAAMEKAKEELELKDADFKRTELELQELRIFVESLEEERRQLQEERLMIKDQIEQYREKVESDVSLINDLNDQLIGLKTRNEELASAVQTGNVPGVDPRRIARLEERIKELEYENKQLEQFRDRAVRLEAENEAIKAQRQQEDLPTANQLAAFEEKLNRLEKENDSILSLHEKLAQLERENAGLRSVAAKLQKLENDSQLLQGLQERIAGLAQADQKLNSLQEQVAQLASQNEELKQELDKVQTGPLSRSVAGPEEDNTHGEELEEAFLQPSGADSVARFDPPLGSVHFQKENVEKNDLTQIEGIGSFIAEKLNSVGIFSFKQIAELNEADIQKLTEAIDFFPGRIERDNWVGQAQKLLEEKDAAPGLVARTVLQDPQDLKIVEGIGPKIEALLKEAGIQSWAELSEAEPDRIREIMLEKGGEHYRVHDPTTWPQQARLAHEEKWDELKEYQDYLLGGRDHSEK